MDRPGQPTKYKPEYCEQIQKFMADGSSKVAFAASIGVCKQTVLNWAKEHEEFFDAMKKAETLCEAFWERQGQNGMYAGKDFNATIWIFNMKARFGYKETQAIEHSGPDGSPIQHNDLSKMTDDQLNAKLAELMSKQNEVNE